MKLGFLHPHLRLVEDLDMKIEPNFCSRDASKIWDMYLETDAQFYHFTELTAKANIAEEQL